MWSTTWCILGAKDFANRDRLAADAAEAPESAGVRQIVFLGGLGDASKEGSLHLRSRAETAERLASGSVPVTTLRSAIVVGDGSAAFETIVALVDRLPAMVSPAGCGRRSRSRCRTSFATSPASPGAARRSTAPSTSWAPRS